MCKMQNTSREDRISLSRYRRRDERSESRRFAETSSDIRTDAARLMQPCSDVCFR